MKKIILIIIFALIFLVPTVSAEIIFENSSIQDTSDQSDAPDTIFGEDVNLIVTDLPAEDGWIFAMFNLSHPEYVGVTAEKVNITLSFGVDRTDAQVFWSVCAYHVNATWIEFGAGGLTRNNNPCGVSFDNGANCNLTPESNATIESTGGVSSNRNETWNITGMWNKAHDTGDANFTVLLRPCGASVDKQDSGYFSREASQTGSRPKLVIVTQEIPDSQNPNFNTSSINNSAPRLDEVVLLSQVVQDETALNTYRFADNRTGNFINSTAFSISGTSVNATFNLTVNLTRGSVISFIWHTEDTSGNANTTAIDSFTVANTPPETPTIIFPTQGLITFLQPMDMNVTFPADADLDSITISYYIDDVLNQTSSTNTTFNASDALYNLKVSLSDGFDSSANASVDFEIDTTNPIITATLPSNNTVHNNNITVDLTCDNLNLRNFSYIFFNSSDILQIEFNSTTNVTQSKITQFIDTTSLGNGAYNLNISCIDNASNTDFEFLILNFDDTAPIFSNLAINNTNANESDIIGISATCSDLNLASIEVQTNASGSFVTEETATISGTSIDFQHNDTAVIGFISHRFICLDVLNQSTTSGLLNYTGTAIPSIPAITGAVVLPIENAVSLVGMLVLFLIIIGLIFGGKAFSNKK